MLKFQAIVTSSQALNGLMRLRTSLTLKVAMRIADYAESEARDAASAMWLVTASQVAWSSSSRRRREGVDLRDGVDRFLAARGGGGISKSVWRGLGMRIACRFRGQNRSRSKPLLHEHRSQVSQNIPEAESRG